MPIRSLSRDEFDDFEPFRNPMAEVIMEEVEWFADDSDKVIGLIARDRSDNDWSVGVLGRDEDGQFRAIDMKTSIERRDAARQELFARMEKTLPTGKKVFPQGD